MDPRPQLPHLPTSNTIGRVEVSEPEAGAAAIHPHTNTVSPSKSESNGGRLPLRPASPTPAWASPTTDRRVHDVCLLLGTIVMLIWPWIFWIVAFHVGGIRMNNHLATVVIDHPQGTSFFVTLIGNLVSLVVDVFFSFSVIRFFQEWMADTREVTVFHISLLSAFRYRFWPWSPKDIQFIFGRERWFLAALAGVCIAAFTFVPSATTSLLAPVSFNKTIPLTGTELDFTSSARECAQFFGTDQFLKNNTCDWQTFGNESYTNCLGQNQLVDVLESGRGNLLSLLSNNSEGYTLNQLRNDGGLRVLGPLRGVLPMGPNGVTAFDGLQKSLLSDPQTRVPMLSYNYTLRHQGLTSNVACSYDTRTPIKFEQVDEFNLVRQYNGTCRNGQVEFLGDYDVEVFPSVNGLNGLGYWACKSRPNPQAEQSYLVYLRGWSKTSDPVGNITCTISPLKYAIFPLTYRSRPDVFSVGEPISITPTVYLQPIERALATLGRVIQESQSWQANLVFESIATFAVKSFKLQPYGRGSKYLRLYEAMIQGILEYEATYIRLIYSGFKTNLPASCSREVEGTATYQVIGWSAKISHIGFLMPMTLLNLSSLALITVVLVKAKGKAHDFDPTGARPLLAARGAGGDTPDEWEDKVVYLPGSSGTTAGGQDMSNEKSTTRDVTGSLERKSSI